MWKVCQRRKKRGQISTKVDLIVDVVKLLVFGHALFYRTINFININIRVKKKNFLLQVKGFI